MKEKRFLRELINFLSHFYQPLTFTSNSIVNYYVGSENQLISHFGVRVGALKLPSMVVFINIKCQQHDKQVHHFSLALHYRYNLEGRGMPAPVSVWWQDKWGCLNVREEGWAPGADRHVFEHNDVATSGIRLFHVKNLLLPAGYNHH